MTITIGCIVGSISAGSINRSIVRGMIEIASEDDGGHELEVVMIPIDELPLYDYERNDDYPAEAQTLKDAIRRSDALPIATPEYNRSTPGVLENAIDWTSRPYGDGRDDPRVPARLADGVPRVDRAIRAG